MKKEIIAGTMILTTALNLNLYAASEGTVTNNTAAQTAATVTTATTAAGLSLSTSPAGLNLQTSQPGLTLTVDEAVERGLKNNIALSKVKNQAELAVIVSDNAEKNKNDISNAQNDLSNAASDISSGRTKAYDSLDQLDAAQAALDNNVAPPGGIPTPSGTIPAGAPIPEAVKTQVQTQLNAKRVQLNNALENLDEGTQKYLQSQSKYDITLKYAMTTVSNKLSTSTISSLEDMHLMELVAEMADVQDRVTSYSVNIYKNKIALLIQNSYYEALKQQKLLDVKKKTMERGKEQYEYASYAYEVGAKSKDDMNYAKLYYDGSVMAYELQQKDYNNAMIELKKNMNMKLDEQINLVEKEADYKSTLDLTQGINSGLRTRLEMKMADAQVELYKDLRAAVDGSGYKESDNQYKEAELLVDKAEIEAADAKVQVESSIRTSYETMLAMQKVLAASSELKKNAEEAVEIAKLKYEVGFGADSTLLKNLNLQDLSGTMVEVIAAEENLSSIEQKVIEATNGYNLAKMKYLNDIGILPYK